MPKGTRKKTMPDKQDDDDKLEQPIEATMKKDVDIGSQETDRTKFMLVPDPYAIGEDGLPAKWKGIPFVDMKAENWRPRKKTKGYKDYLTMRRTWIDSNGRTRYLERGMGPFNEERYTILRKLLLDDPEGEESEGAEDTPSGNTDSPVTMTTVDESSRPRRLTQPPAWTVKGTRLLQSAVGRHINIPDRFYYDTDILEFYEYFHNKGYVGTIVDWIHECLRNYMIEHHYHVGVMIEKGMMIQNG